MSIKVLALDLEHTLIDNALSSRPRQGLFDFLEFCSDRFERVAMYTTVEEADAREVVEDLAQRGHIPPSVPDRLEFINWFGEYKDLSFISNAEPHEILLVDDDAGWIKPDQHERWIPIVAWQGEPDRELFRIRIVLEKRLSESSSDVFE